MYWVPLITLNISIDLNFSICLCRKETYANNITIYVYCNTIFSFNFYLKKKLRIRCLIKLIKNILTLNVRNSSFIDEIFDLNFISPTI